MTGDDTITSKNIEIFKCFNCHFKCSKKGDYNRHILTAKHQNNVLKTVNDDAKMTKDDAVIIQEVKKNTNSYYECSCGKEYKYRQGLFVHKKKCKEKPQNQVMMTINEKEPTPTMLTNEMVMNILSQNSELIKLLEQQMAKDTKPILSMNSKKSKKQKHSLSR